MHGKSFFMCFSSSSRAQRSFQEWHKDDAFYRIGDKANSTGSRSFLGLALLLSTTTTAGLVALKESPWWCTMLQHVPTDAQSLIHLPTILESFDGYRWVGGVWVVCFVEGAASHPTPTFYVSRLHKLRMNRFLMEVFYASHPLSLRLLNFAFNESASRTFHSASWCNFDLCTF